MRYAGHSTASLATCWSIGRNKMKARRRVLLLLSFMMTAYCAAQSGVRIEGTITDESGSAVKYASVGILGRGIGVLSDADGTFCLNADAGPDDTLVVSHISYHDIRISAGEFLNLAGRIVMKTREQQLGEIVVNSGRSRKVRLAARGTKIPGGATMWTVANKGCEVGSVVDVKGIFELQEISFSVRSNGIPGAVFSVNIYKENDSTGEFSNALCKPVYFNIPVSEKKQEVIVGVGDDVVIAPGRYFVSIMFADHDCIDSETAATEPRIYFPLYLKSSYTRKGVMSRLEPVPMNMGLCLKGVEYR